MEKNLTIDDLAASTAKGFEQVHEKLDGLVTREEFRAELRDSREQYQEFVKGQTDLILTTIRKDFSARLDRVETTVRELQPHAA